MQPSRANTRAPPVWLAAAYARLAEACQEMRGRRLPWLALAYGCGVGAYFALPVEPSSAAVLVLAVGVAAAWVLAWWARGGAGFVPLVLGLAMAGLLTGVLRTAVVAGPVLPFRYYGAVEGRVVHLDRSATGAKRVTLDRVRLDGVAPAETPRRVRLSLHGDPATEPRPGMRVMTTAHLSPPSGPAEPGGFDFQRHAWFLKLGAIGYARVPLLLAEAPEGGASLALSRLRAFISDGLRDRLPGRRGEVAAAITTGDRSGLPEDVVEALRASNLAHLLAISGLHMGLLVGFVFWTTRGALALIPPVALRYPLRSWAALVALPFALFYLFLSGGTVATQRAFIMAAVMLGAVLLGRRALSLRSVALAALIVLAWRPESLTGPGFQMSFAATGALVIAFRALTDLRGRDGWAIWFRGWRGAVLALLVSSVVAGLATAPFAAAHFNRVGNYGVLANLLAVPMMGTVVMPLLLVGLLLWPLGLEALPFWLAGLGIEWIIAVASWVAALPGSLGHVVAPGPWVLPLLGLAFGVFGAARALPGRAVGVAVLALALGLWSQARRPDMLISADGRLVGILADEGRWLSRERGAGFAADTWLENDGDPAAQWQAALRGAEVLGLPEVIPLRGKTGLDDALDTCGARGAWVVTPVRVERASTCAVYDATTLGRLGAVAVWTKDGGAGLRVDTAADRQGMRPWTRAWQIRAGEP